MCVALIRLSRREKSLFILTTTPDLIHGPINYNVSRNGES